MIWLGVFLTCVLDTVFYFIIFTYLFVFFFRVPCVIREAIWIRKTNMNQGGKSYQLSHVWDKLLTDVRNHKSVPMKTSADRSKRR